MTNELELDHLFICVQPEAPEAELLKEFGLIEGRRRSHPGQGTTNVCFLFQNAYLELLWLCNAQESQSPIVRPMGLWERCRWRETQACPFGIAFRRVASDSLELPFTTWNYYAPFLPSGNAIAIANNSNNLAEPLIFMSPTFQNPLTESLPLIHQIEVNTITGLSVTLPGEGAFSVEIAKLIELGLVKFSRGDRYHLEIEFDNGKKDKLKRFDPILPLSIRW
jgi:Glyoxalase-like domain